MNIAIGLLVAGFLIWLFLIDNSRRGLRTVKAFVYLRAIKEGKPQQEAAAISEAVGAKAPTRLVQETMLELQTNYRSKAKLLNEAAEKAGWRG
jgi:hypothetical protein